MPAVKKSLILFAKSPKPGRVKTRFRPMLSPAEAGRIYRSFILDTLTASASIKGVKRFLACDPTRRDAFFIRLARRHELTLIDQTGEDLGARMRNAVLEANRRGFDQAVIIGMDIPTLPPAYVQEAFRQLKKVPLVLGPSLDGGYYLIGCSGRVPPIFDGIDWGTERVLTQTLDRIRQNHLKAALLPFWYDVDTVGDLQFLTRHLEFLKRESGKSVAPETERVLKTLKWDASKT